MRVLLDTHIFLWWDNAPDQLSAQALSLCQDSANTLVLSVVSVWEMQIKQQLGKLTLRLPLAELIEDQQKTNGIEILPVSLAHVLLLESLPSHHKDPFDRLLIAQANAEDISLLSVDPSFKQYPVKLLN
ncbi:MAG: type II toxin-antitoxin system VapC family toxin [Abitibacteriaceae bacterium]|nr:type II toxin-antitoxin system VapC family toxin [Abditibacteriaceae bacterium]